MAHPLNRPALDGRGARRRGLRHPAAARHAVAPDRARGIALPAPRLGAGRDRPLCGGGLGRLPGPVRRRLLHRQGHLRRRRLRGGAGRARARERAAQPRPLRGRSSPAPASPRTSSSWRSFPPATTSPPSASTAGRAATGSSCPGSSGGARRDGRSAAARCSTTCAGRCWRPRRLLALGLGWLLPWPAAPGRHRRHPRAAR